MAFRGQIPRSGNCPSHPQNNCKTFLGQGSKLLKHCLLFQTKLDALQKTPGFPERGSRTLCNKQKFFLRERCTKEKLLEFPPSSNWRQHKLCLGGGILLSLAGKKSQCTGRHCGTSMFNVVDTRCLQIKIDLDIVSNSYRNCSEATYLFLKKG